MREEDLPRLTLVGRPFGKDPLTDDVACFDFDILWPPVSIVGCVLRAFDGIRELVSDSHCIGNSLV